MKRKIIFGIQDPGGANAVLPVIKWIKEKNSNNVEFKIYAAEKSKNILLQNDLPFINCDNYDSIDIFKIVEKEKPDMIVTGTSYRFSLDNKLVCAGKELGILSVSILDWWSNYWKRFSDLEKGEKFKYLPNYVVIMDNIAKQEMISEGFDENQLLVFGNPYFDELIQICEKNKKSKKTQSSKKEKKIVYISSYMADNFNGDDKKTKEKYGYNDKEVFSDLLDILDKIYSKEKPFEVTIRPHPKENIDDYKILQKLKYHVTTENKSNPRKTLLDNDIVIGANSIMLFEAAMIGKSVISYQPNLKGQDYEISNRVGITKLISNKDEFKRKLHEILSTDNLKPMPPEINNKIESTILDGRSTERVVGWILNKLNLK